MKKLLVALLFLALPTQAFAAIAFGASLGTGSANSTTISKTSLTISGSNLGMVFWLESDNITFTVSSMNWDDGSGGSAQAFTQIGNYQTIDTNGSVGRISMWGLVAPNTSNSRVIANFSSSGGINMGGGYYTGVKQTSAFTTGSGGNTNGVTSFSQADTSDADGSWHIGIAQDNNSSMSEGAGTTRRVAVGNSELLDDSNATVANGVSHTLNWNQSVAGAREAWVTAMMRPAADVAVSGSSQDLIMIEDE